MTDIVERLHTKHVYGAFEIEQQRQEAANEIARLRFFVEWVDSIVSNPVSSYSVHALDGLFGMTRDRIAALSNGPRPSPSVHHAAAAIRQTTVR